MFRLLYLNGGTVLKKGCCRIFFQKSGNKLALIPINSCIYLTFILMKRELLKMVEQRFATDKRSSLQPVNCENRGDDDPPTGGGGGNPPPPGK